MKVTVEEPKCAASGECVRIAPGLFELDEFGYSLVVGDGTVPRDRENEALDAVRSCPMQAISANDKEDE